MTKKNFLITIIFLTIIIMSFVSSSLYEEAYCSTRAQVEMQGKGFVMVPATEADVKQVPNLGYKVGQKIGLQFSKELACERQFKRFIFF